jgi:toxin ParE1/3/4
MAERGRIVPEYNAANVRELFVGSYRLIYQVTEESAVVVGFIHGARDLLGLLKKGPPSER